jgi:hypothetical protein
MTADSVFIGIDAAKADYAVACRPSGVTWTATNDARGIADTVARASPRQHRPSWCWKRPVGRGRSRS